MPGALGLLGPQDELGILVIFIHCRLHPAPAHVCSSVCILMGPVGLCILSHVCCMLSPQRICFILQRMCVCIFIGGRYGRPTSLLQGAESSPFKTHIHSASQLSYSSRKTSWIGPTSSSTGGGGGGCDIHCLCLQAPRLPPPHLALQSLAPLGLTCADPRFTIQD